MLTQITSEWHQGKLKEIGNFIPDVIVKEM